MKSFKQLWSQHVGAGDADTQLEKGFNLFDSPNGWQSYLQPGNASRESLLRFAAASPSEIALLHCKSGIYGISQDEAVARRKLAGPNILSVKKPLPWWKILLLSIPNPFNILLGALAIISVATPPPTWSNFAIIMFMIVISCLVRFWQEYRSSVASIKLQASISATTPVRRPQPKLTADHIGCGFVEQAVHSQDLVPGDVIALNPGDSLPADCLLLETIHLHVSQSSLTGESRPIRKSTTVTVDENIGEAVFDLDNVAFMGTSVVSGSGIGLVIATGDRVFIASITEQLSKKRPQNAFERGILQVSYLMIGFMVTMVSIVLVVRGKLSNDWGSAIVFSLSVAVGIVPEMLPAIVNTNLARGAYVLAKQGAIVKMLGSVQNFGSMSILCSDKTGTLTMDQISLCRAEDFAGEESSNVLRLGCTNAFHQSGKRNEIDAAMVRKYEDNPITASLVPGDLVAQIPFHFEKRRSSVVIRDGQHPNDNLLLICKGAFEEVLGLCNLARSRQGGPLLDLVESHRQAVYRLAHEYNDDGYRVLAVATCLLPANSDVTSLDALEELDSSIGMVFEGLLTFLDPPREDAAASIASLQELGVEIKILTGDNMRIATKVCRCLNICGKASWSSSSSSADAAGEDQPDTEVGIKAVTGPELARLSDEEFHEVVREASVLAKLTPAQKGQVVQSLKQGGRSVGMLGDGINDCIALRYADVGISVNNAVSMAKECADVILTEKRLGIILAGVRIGRLTHGNTMKYIKMVASSNFGNVLSVLIASAWLPYQPMTSLQILLQNLLYDISQIALPWDRMDEEYLRAPKEWDIWDLLRFIVILGPTSSTIDMCTFGLNWFYFGIRTVNDPRVPLANTHWFLQGLLTQTIVVHVLRTGKIPILQSRPTAVLAFSTLVVSGIGIALPYIPAVSSSLRLVTPASTFMGFLAAELALYVLGVQLIKVMYKRIFNRWL